MAIIRYLLTGYCVLCQIVSSKFENIINFLSFLNTEMAQIVETLPHGLDKDSFILYCQNHGCWWPGEARSHDISSHGIDLIPTQYFTISTQKLKWTLAKIASNIHTSTHPLCNEAAYPVTSPHRKPVMQPMLSCDSSACWLYLLTQWVDMPKVVVVARSSLSWVLIAAALSNNLLISFPRTALSVVVNIGIEFNWPGCVSHWNGWWWGTP